VFAVMSFFSSRFGQRAGCLTKRAPDVWESARFRSIFLALVFFYISSIVHARPHAGNASRWQELAVNLSFVFQNFLVGKIGVLSLANQGFGF